ncbi:MAG: serine/threonine protein kinase [Gemmatimonadetes bacterium]|nr:serine/threonine protein kinase [Gemmatimonadota bacterium]
MDADLRDALVQALGPDYELGPEIGRGGMGVVYRATDLSLQRDVAIKVLPPELSYRKDLRARFTREAQLAGGLNHPHIVPIYDVGEGHTLVWYEMALIEGESVRARVEREGPLTEPQTRRIIREVAWALGYAHARGIIHRDIKPDNIMLEQGTGRALVTDFGIAKMAETDGATQPGMILGSLMYMAPEQATGEDDIDGRADIYSLGLCGHFMLGGKAPFDKATIVTVAARIATGATPDFEGIEQPIDPAFRSLLEKCVAADPNDRWDDAEAILEALGPQALAPRPMPASIRRLVRDFMLVPTVGFLFLVIDIVADAPTGEELIAWMALALCINFGVTLKKFTERGFRWPDLREGLEMEIARQSEELEATGALKDRFSALVYIATASATAVGLVQAWIQSGRWELTVPVGLAIAALGILVSFPISWIQVRIYTFFGRLFLKLWPSLPRPEAESWFSRVADRWLTKLFRPIRVKPSADDDPGLFRATSGWTASDVGAARRSTRSIDDIFTDLPRDLRRIAQPALELARDLTASVGAMRHERAQLDRRHGDAVASVAANSKAATHTLQDLRTLLENVASGAADPSELEAMTEQIAAMLESNEVPAGQAGPTGRKRWLGGVLLDSAVTGTVRVEEESPNLQRIATDITSEWDRRTELQSAWALSRDDVPDVAEKASRLQASIALHTQRGKHLDPAAAESVTECESLLAELLGAIKRFDADSEGGTQQIDGLIKKINDLHVQIEVALKV